MNVPVSYDSCRYLTSKITVDDRALNRRLWEQFLNRLTELHEKTGRVKILEVGGGIGATVNRLMRALRRTPIKTIDYTFVEVNSEHLHAAQEKLQQWGKELGYEVECKEHQLRFTTEGPVVTVELVLDDAFSFFEKRQNSNRFNAVIAQAWIDIVNIQKALTGLQRVLHKQDGLLYLPIHFDGITSFLPLLDDDLDRRIERLYHQSMSRTPQGPAGGSTTGRKLLEMLSERKALDVTAGSSDWIVVPNEDKDYPADEAYFLHHILHFVHEELKDTEALESQRFSTWLDERRKQIEKGQLIYMAHQLDILAETL